jgi:acetyl-CoA carboxylase carboxyltransferase component
MSELLQTRAPMQAQLVQWVVAVGDVVQAGDVLLILEAMKMEHELRAQADGTVTQRFFDVGDIVNIHDLLLILELNKHTIRRLKPNLLEKSSNNGISSDMGARNDLRAVIDRHAFTLDTQRPEATAKRHTLGLRTARENIADLCDIDNHADVKGVSSFLEYGALAIAAQRARRTHEDLITNTPADGMVTGIGSINGALFDAERTKAVVMAYDATVLAGTQGLRNHQKTDRLLGIALQNRLPVVLFAEGGGGRPGDTDAAVVAGLHVTTFASFARLHGHVPVIGITTGRCFAGNAALLGCCDVIIATRSSNIGMGGPAMIEGGGLGVFKPEQIGPSTTQHTNGVIDILVDDEASAVAAAKQYLSYFQGRLKSSVAVTAPDATALRHVVPENRLRAYDSREAMEGLADSGSLQYLRTGYGVGMHTALARIDGRAVGIMANNPLHLGGAIDADACRKAARFMRLCNTHGLPIVSLVDTPGFMVGPETEATGQVRAAGDLFVAAAQLVVPYFSVVLRKGYGLGAMAMTAGGFHSPMFTVAWPTGEFGAMGLEGAIRLGYRKELGAAANEAAREALFQQLLAREIAKGSAISMAEHLEIDAVIDPAQTRPWLISGLVSAAAKTSDTSIT